MLKTSLQVRFDEVQHLLVVFQTIDMKTIAIQRIQIDNKNVGTVNHTA